MAGIDSSYVFDGRYAVVRRLGTGGMAEVFEARDPVLDRSVAIKVLLPRYANDAAFVRRLKEEARAAASLTNPHVVSIYDCLEDQGRYIVIMEYVRGTDLKNLIKSQGCLPPARVAQIAQQVCSALAEAHSHDVIHRDVKSSNIMLKESGDAKVMDFGIACAGGQTLSGAVMGTVHYMSPEQIRGLSPAPSSDLYSLGVVMYEASTGRLPFTADDPLEVAQQQLRIQPVAPRALNPALDEQLEAIILKAMAKTESQRYGSATEMRRDLEDYLEGRSSTPTTSPSTQAPVVWALAFLKAPSGLEGKVAVLKGPAVLGRGREAHISIPDSSISARHALLTPNGAHLAVEDLGSANGVLVNGARITRKAQCGPGDVITVGEVSIAVGRG